MPVAVVTYALYPITPSVLAAAGRTWSIDVVGLAPGPGDVERLLQGHLAQAGLDGLDGHLHRQQAADLVFGQMQDGHRGLGAVSGGT